MEKKLVTEKYFELHEDSVRKYGDKTIILYQMGQFYVMYGTDDMGYDLKILSKILNIILTRKNNKKSNEEINKYNPRMMGFNCISKLKYINVLIRNGFTIVIVDEYNDMGNIKRKITKTISPGTYIENIDYAKSNNMMSIYICSENQLFGEPILCCGNTIIDISTGYTEVIEYFGESDDNFRVLDNIKSHISGKIPTEIYIINESHLLNDFIINYLEIDKLNYSFVNQIDNNIKNCNYQNKLLEKIYNINDIITPLEFLNLERSSFINISLIYLLENINKKDETLLVKLKYPEIKNIKNHMILGNNVSYHLNIIDENETNEHLNKNQKSLFNIINHTSTAMGTRTLRSFLLNPIIDPDKIKKRYDITQDILDNNLCNELELKLNGMLDIERLNRRILLKRIHPYELYNLFSGYDRVFEIIETLEKIKNFSLTIPDKNKLYDGIKYFKYIFNVDKLKKIRLETISENFFNETIFPKIDKIQKNIENKKDLLENITNILTPYIPGNKKKKIYLKYNNSEGYFLQLTKLRYESMIKNIGNKKIKINETTTISINDINVRINRNNVKIKFQELTNASNFIISKTNKMILEIKKSFDHVLDIFINEHNNIFIEVIKFVGILDCWKSNAKCAIKYGFIKPEIIKNKENGFVKTKKLRHPIVERLINTKYIPHSINLGVNGNNKISGMLLYSLNSGGKSILMKSVGISIIMAQSGMYVPAEEYIYAPYTSIYARISRNDDLFRGLSSFSLEMYELKSILKRSSNKTLIIGDEVCSGTEYISGTSIVASTIINLSNKGSSFIFATHLHEIPKMEEIKVLKNIKTYHLTVNYDKKLDTLIFDRILKEGIGNEIYGITVAKYIIRDKSFIKNAEKIKDKLMGNTDIIGKKKSRYNKKKYIGECEICGVRKKTGMHTHHIIFQNGGKNKIVDGMDINNECNLVVLCDNCHSKVHKNTIIIEGYKNTINGKKLKYTEKKKRKRKYNEDDIVKIFGLKNKLSKIEAKKYLKHNENMNIGIGTIKKIWDEKY